MNIIILKDPLPEQDGPFTGSQSILETLSSRTVAFQLTLYDWDLLNCIHEVNKFKLNLLD